MSKYTFDCFVCPASLETDDLAEVVAFGNEHKDHHFEPEESE